MASTPGKLFDPATGVVRQATPEEWAVKVFDERVPGQWRIGSVQEIEHNRAVNRANMRKLNAILLVGASAAVWGGYRLWGTKGAIAVVGGGAGVLVLGVLALANR